VLLQMPGKALPLRSVVVRMTDLGGRLGLAGVLVFVSHSLASSVGLSNALSINFCLIVP